MRRHRTSAGTEQNTPRKNARSRNWRGHGTLLFEGLGDFLEVLDDREVLWAGIHALSALDAGGGLGAAGAPGVVHLGTF